MTAFSRGQVDIASLPSLIVLPYFKEMFSFGVASSGLVGVGKRWFSCVQSTVFWTFWFETTIFLFIGLRQFGQLLREFS